MLAKRVIPCLQWLDGTLVKTVRFARPAYIGDPVNTVRIFNELEVDELCVLDIRASLQQREPDLKALRELASECFMPLSYGGGIRSARAARDVLAVGCEKVVLNSAVWENPGLLREIASECGSQSVIAAVDVRRNLWGHRRVCTCSGTRQQRLDPVAWAQQLQELGAGELLLTSIDREGTWKGFDLDLLARVASEVSIPVIASGGAGSLAHIREALVTAGASAVALGSMVVYQGPGLGVLVSFPDRHALSEAMRP